MVSLVLFGVLTACGAAGGTSTSTTVEQSPSSQAVARTTTSQSTTTSTILQSTTTGEMSNQDAPELDPTWRTEIDLLVIAGPNGIKLLSPGTGQVETVSSQPMANALGGVEWGFVVHPADGSEHLRTSTSPVWWFRNGATEPSIVFEPPTNPESDQPFEIELYSIIEVEGERGALIRIHAFQNDDLWVHQPLAGGPAREIGFMSGGELEVGCAAYDGSHLYLAASAHSATIGKWTLDARHTSFLPKEDDGWPFATSCVALLPTTEEVLGMVQFWDENGSHPPALIVTADLDGNVIASVELTPEINGAVSLDIDSVGFLVVTTIDGKLWHVTGISGTAIELPITGLRASYID